MAGTKTGGELAAQTNIERYGADYFQRIGKLGGSKSNNGGFGAGELGKQRARLYGALGGSMSRRSPSKLSDAERKQRRDKFQKQYEKTLQRLQNVHAAAMQGREQS